MKAREPLKCEFVICDTEKTMEPEEIVRGIFGISIQQLIKDIQLNKDGKYDALYITPA